MQADNRPGQTVRPEPEVAPAELVLEREKLQIERERLALERDRLQAERDVWDHDRTLGKRASGRISLATSAFLISLLSAMVLGGVLGAWVQTLHRENASNRFAKGLFQALVNATNLSGSATQEQLLRALGEPGHGVSLLILD